MRVYVLGVPGYDLLLQDLARAGYSASLYGPAGRPADGFEVIAIGAAVPASIAIELIAMARRRIPSLRHIVLAGDVDRIATEANEVSIGGTNGLMDQFPRARALTDSEFADLIRRGSSRNDLFYESIRRTYQPASGTSAGRSQEGFFVRDDGVVVVPREDGGASLYASNGRRGTRRPDGQEMWLQSNLAPVPPARQGDPVDEQWITQMNRWLESLGERLNRDLELLLPNEDSIRNYRLYEDAHADNLYDRVYLRRQYLSLVIDRLFPAE